jgi:hypothetical protein
MQSANCDATTAVPVLSGRFGRMMAGGSGPLVTVRPGMCYGRSRMGRGQWPSRMRNTPGAAKLAAGALWDPHLCRGCEARSSTTQTTAADAHLSRFRPRTSSRQAVSASCLDSLISRAARLMILPSERRAHTGEVVPRGGKFPQREDAGNSEGNSIGPMKIERQINLLRGTSIPSRPIFPPYQPLTRRLTPLAPASYAVRRDDAGEVSHPNVAAGHANPDDHAPVPPSQHRAAREGESLSRREPAQRIRAMRPRASHRCARE